MDIIELYQLYQQSNGVNTDTRKITEGELYFALRGDRFDGNAHAEEALNKGASHAIIDNQAYYIDERTILVDDVLLTLQALARHHAKTFDNPIIGLTGSNGKTTTKELLHLILSTRYNVNTTSGNFNNHIGVPLSILKGGLDQDYWLIEMGTNAPGEIEFLCDIALPNYGLITNIGAAHLEKLIDLDGVYTEKTSLFNSVVDDQGVVFLNEQDRYLNQYDLTDETQVIAYTPDDCAYGHLELKSQHGLLEFQLTDQTGTEHLVKTNLAGRFNQANISAALTVGHHLGVNLSDAIEAIASYYPDNMRSQLKRTDKNLLLLDNYNANPSSMKESIASFIESDHDAPICIIGDMLELGVQADRYHLEIIDLLTKYGVDYYLVGSCFARVNNEAYPDVNALQEYLQNSAPLVGRTILLKGSRGIALEKLLEIL